MKKERQTQRIRWENLNLRTNAFNNVYQNLFVSPFSLSNGGFVVSSFSFCSFSYDHALSSPLLIPPSPPPSLFLRADPHYRQFLSRTEGTVRTSIIPTFILSCPRWKKFGIESLLSIRTGHLSCYLLSQLHLFPFPRPLFLCRVSSVSFCSWPFQNSFREYLGDLHNFDEWRKRKRERERNLFINYDIERNLFISHLFIRLLHYYVYTFYYRINWNNNRAWYALSLLNTSSLIWLSYHPFLLILLLYL